jgi:hypothetical protein
MSPKKKSTVFKRIYEPMSNKSSTGHRKLNYGDIFYFIKSRRIRRVRHGAWLE